MLCSAVQCCAVLCSAVLYSGEGGRGADRLLEATQVPAAPLQAGQQEAGRRGGKEGQQDRGVEEVQPGEGRPQLCLLPVHQRSVEPAEGVFIRFKRMINVLLSNMCICGYFGVFGCICGFYKYDLWIFCDFFFIFWIIVVKG